MSNDTVNHDKLIENTELVSKLVGDFLNKTDDDTKQRTGSIARGHKFFARDDVIAALSKMQLSYRPEYTPGQAVNINTNTFKSALLNQMASQSGGLITKSVNQIDGRTIDFVEMIFGAFLRDPNITYAIKSLLMRLQIPIIKIALLDLKFFYNPKHSARHALDSIAHIGIGIEDKNSTIYQTMDLIVEQLLRGFDMNISSFNTALMSLQRLTDIEKKKQEQNEVQTRQHIRQEHARQMVMAELQFHMLGKPIPKVVQPLILKFWSTLMFHECIRHGKASQQWKQSVVNLRRIVNSLQPIQDEDDWLRLSSSHQQVTNAINLALNASNQNKELIFGAVQTLQRVYENMLSESPYRTNPTSQNETPATDFAQEEVIDEKLLAANKKLARLPEEIKPGTWFEVFDGDNRPIRRFKLSVIVTENARLVFVDRLGTKGLEKDADEFVAELANGKSRVIADHSIFNHALGQVIRTLASNR